eukprot:scaffold656828_cov51-Prasinocladus_malaysianus.AAC.1
MSTDMTQTTMRAFRIIPANIHEGCQMRKMAASYSVTEPEATFQRCFEILAMKRIKSVATSVHMYICGDNAGKDTLMD